MAERYAGIFDKFDTEQGGFLAEGIVNNILAKSGLDEGTLGDIWAISNVENADSLSCEQFTTAMHLTQLVKEEGFDLRALRDGREPADSLQEVPEPAAWSGGSGGSGESGEEDVEYETIHRTPSGKRSKTTLHETGSRPDVVVVDGAGHPPGEEADAAGAEAGIEAGEADSASDAAPNNAVDSEYESHNRTWEQLSDNFMAQVSRLAQLDVEDKARARKLQARRKRRLQSMDRRTKARQEQQELRSQLLAGAGYQPDGNIQQQVEDLIAQHTAMQSAEHDRAAKEQQRAAADSARREEQLARAVREQKSVQERLEKARADKRAAEAERITETLRKAQQDQRRIEADQELLRQQDGELASVERENSDSHAAQLLHERAAQQHQAIHDQLAKAKEAEHRRRSNDAARSEQIKEESARIKGAMNAAEVQITEAEQKQVRITLERDQFTRSAAEESNLTRRASAQDVFEMARRERSQKLANLDTQLEQRRHTVSSVRKDEGRTELSTRRPADVALGWEAKLLAEKEEKTRKAKEAEARHAVSFGAPTAGLPLAPAPAPAGGKKKLAGRRSVAGVDGVSVGQPKPSRKVSHPQSRLAESRPSDASTYQLPTTPSQAPVIAQGSNWRDQREVWVPPSERVGIDVQSPLDTARNELKKISPSKFEPVAYGKESPGKTQLNFSNVRKGGQSRLREGRIDSQGQPDFSEIEDRGRRGSASQPPDDDDNDGSSSVLDRIARFKKMQNDAHVAETSPPKVRRRSSGGPVSPYG